MTVPQGPRAVCACGLPAGHDPQDPCRCGHTELDHRMEHDDICLICDCPRFCGGAPARKAAS